ncbi:MAG: hypothetical protein HYS07_07535 [Chlamydiae bacterium]|nr:hypothetical protein [Chlamydiota bacterium]MBI3277596.1 hypothetical protein [Chlamydiota bacterium]
MKSYRSLLTVALGLLLGFSVMSSYAGMTCPACKASMPASSKPVLEMLKEDAKCSMCSAELKVGTEVSKMTCPACKAEMIVCSTCAKANQES